MKNIILLLAVMVASSNLFGRAIKIKESKIEWSAEKVIGGGHEGTIELKKGSVEFEDNKIVFGYFVMDMKTISVTDIDGSMADKFIDHMFNDDFFSVDIYPEAILSDVRSSGFIANKAVCYGNLTIKGISKHIEFEVYLEDNILKTNIDIDRTLYGIRYGSGSFFDDLGDKAIADIFTLAVEMKL